MQKNYIMGFGRGSKNLGTERVESGWWKEDIDGPGNDAIIIFGIKKLL